MMKIVASIFVPVVLVVAACAPKAQDDATSLARNAFYAIEEKPFDSDNLKTAFIDIGRANELNPEDPWVAIAISRVILEMGYRKGNRYFKRSFEPEALKKALDYAERAVRLGPTESVAHSQLARVQIILGDYRSAWYTLNHAYERDTSDFYPWYLRGVISVRMKDVERAESALDQADKLATRLYQRRVILQERIDLGRLTKDSGAMERYHLAVIDLDPQNPHSHGNYGSFLLYQNRYDEAIRSLEKALSISPYPLAEKLLQEAKRKKAEGDLSPGTQAE